MKLPPINNPTPDSATNKVIAELHKRVSVGLDKYGVTVSGAGLPLTAWLKHMQEELLDGAVYATQIMTMLEASSPPPSSPPPSSPPPEHIDGALRLALARIIEWLPDLCAPPDGTFYDNDTRTARAYASVGAQLLDRLMEWDEQLVEQIAGAPDLDSRNPSESPKESKGIFEDTPPPALPSSPLPNFKCLARQSGDWTECAVCGITWDTNDSAPPPCPILNPDSRNPSESPKESK